MLETNYTFFKISLMNMIYFCVTESHLDVIIYNDDLLLDFFSKTFIRKDRNNSGGGLLIYFKDDISVERVTLRK